MGTDAKELIQRILAEDRAPVFIIGSGVPMPLVPGTEEIVQLASAEFGRRLGSEKSEKFLSEIPSKGNRYQSAFELLSRQCGADAVNAVIREAVLNAQDRGTDPQDVALARNGDGKACERLADNLNSWQLNDGLRALGQVATRLSKQRCCWIVTTNFDPLIDVAVRAAGGRVVPVAFARDGDSRAIRDQVGYTIVVHVHGDWYRADTLHTPEVLTRPRPVLEASLRGLLRDNLVVVLGYAGWDDVITSALKDVVIDPRGRIDLRWAFRESEMAEIEKRYADLVVWLKPVQGVRAWFHLGVDAQQFLPALASELASRPEPSRVREAGSGSPTGARSARQQDLQILRRVRELAVRWRGQYAVKLGEVCEAAERAKHWSCDPPATLTEDVIQVIELAGDVARDLNALPVDELQFASSYGLNISPSVFERRATNEALDLASYVTAESRQTFEAFSEAVGGLGSDPGLPAQHRWEFLARVLDAAERLACFDISTLPLGYQEDAGHAVPHNLQADRCLLIAELDNDPGLNVLAPGPPVERVGSFVARSLWLHALCAQRNREGSLDLLGSDDHHVYYWRESSQVPINEFANRERILDAVFQSSAVGAPVLWIDAQGTTGVFRPEGECETIAGPLESDVPLHKARVWVDPLDDQDWHVVAVTSDYDVTSSRSGKFSQRRSAKDLWLEPAAFRSEFKELDFWAAAEWVALTVLQGLPCLVVSRAVKKWAGVHFLDPRTLASIRRPLLIRARAGEMTIAAGRWLVVALHESGSGPGHRVAVWDLDAKGDSVAGSGLEVSGDMYQPIVVAEDRSSFRTIQVNRQFGVPRDEVWTLYSFDWPSGRVEMLGHHSRLRISSIVKCVR